MNDEETFALIGGRDSSAGPRRRDADLVGQSRGLPVHLSRSLGTSHVHWQGRDAITSGLEVTWTTTPTQWSNDFLETCSATSGS